MFKLLTLLEGRRNKTWDPQRPTLIVAPGAARAHVCGLQRLRCLTAGLPALARASHASYGTLPVESIDEGNSDEEQT